MDPDKLDELRQWLLTSDARDFAAIVVRHGRIVLEVERNLSAKTATGDAKSCAKAICATVLSTAVEASAQGHLPYRMDFDDRAFKFIPWAYPLSDPRKEQIVVAQLLNHVSGITPERTGAPYQGPWEFVLGHTGDPLTQELAFDPGTDIGYSSHAFNHVSLLCEHVTGMPYDQFAIKSLLRPIGVEHWWFGVFEGGPRYGSHPTHVLGMPARDLARIPYCMLQGGMWEGQRVIPRWFVEETASPTHNLTGARDFGRDAESWSHGWELPGRLTDGRGRDIPVDARYKPGSGGQLIAFVPTLDLVLARHTGSSGEWDYEGFVRNACAAVID